MLTYPETCREKVSYRKEKDAIRAKNNLLRAIRRGYAPNNKEGRLIHYRCNHCLKWHVGHNTESE